MLEYRSHVLRGVALSPDAELLRVRYVVRYSFVNELTEIYGIPQEAVTGGADTMYPEYRKKLTNYKRPEVCVRYCGCGGLGVPCITDGSRVPQK